MRLTVAETETLNHYMTGLGFVEIAQMQNVNNTTKKGKNKMKTAVIYTRYSSERQTE